MEQQISLARLTAITRVQFAPVVLAADPMANVVEESSGRALRTLSDVRLLAGVCTAGRRRS